MEYSPEKLIELLNELDESWPHTKGTRLFLVQMYHKSQVKHKEEKLKEYLEQYPYTSAAAMSKMELSYATHFAFLIILEWLKLNNSAFISQFLSRLAYTATEHNVRTLARHLLNQYVNELQ